jgi:hypothetical protein
VSIVKLKEKTGRWYLLPGKRYTADIKFDVIEIDPV